MRGIGLAYPGDGTRRTADVTDQVALPCCAALPWREPPLVWGFHGVTPGRLLPGGILDRRLEREQDGGGVDPGGREQERGEDQREREAHAVAVAAGAETSWARLGLGRGLPGYCLLARVIGC